MSIPVIPPAFIGRYVTGGVAYPMAVGEREHLRAQGFFHRLLRDQAPFRARNALIVSTLAEAANMLPFERALIDLGAAICAAEANAWDGMRAESILRRFDVAIVAPVGAITLDAIAAAGFDPAVLFRDKLVFAKPDAHARLQGAPGIDLRRWLEIGPVVALEHRLDGGLVYDAREWSIESDGTKTWVTSRLDRAHHFDRVEIDMGLRFDGGNRGARILI
jgi:hypothetical protein